MLVHANQNKLQQLKDGMIWNRMLLPNVYVYVVFFNDIKIKMCLIKTQMCQYFLAGFFVVKTFLSDWLKQISSWLLLTAGSYFNL